MASRAQQIEAWWQEGLPASEIARRMGWTKARVGTEVSRLRKRGYDLPYRRSPEEVRNIQAGWQRVRGTK